jgi:hypothetical protein
MGFGSKGRVSPVRDEEVEVKSRARSKSRRETILEIDVSNETKQDLLNQFPLSLDDIENVSQTAKITEQKLDDKNSIN